MRTVIIAIVCLAVGVVGFAIAYFIYTPQIRIYTAYVSGLTSQLNALEESEQGLRGTMAELETTIANKDALISKQEAQTSSHEITIANQEAEISSIQTETVGLRSQLLSAESNAEYYKDILVNTEKTLSSVQDRLKDVLNITVTQRYKWDYSYHTGDWDLPITLSDYVACKEKPRLSSPSGYAGIASDICDDEYIASIVGNIKEAITTLSSASGFNQIQTLNFVIAFVQSLPYTLDEETAPYDEYPRYPIETLFERGGDSEDNSILTAAILDEMGYDIAILILENAHHVAVGVALDIAYGSYYEYDGKKYCYLETTGEGWRVGQIPFEITDTRAQVYPL